MVMQYAKHSGSCDLLEIKDMVVSDDLCEVWGIRTTVPLSWPVKISAHTECLPSFTTCNLVPLHLVEITQERNYTFNF